MTPEPRQSNPLAAFFLVVFGGLIVICIGIGIVALGETASQMAQSRSQALYVGSDALSPAAQQASAPDEPRYTAAEEEDVIDAAAQSLPPSAIKNISAKEYIVDDLTSGTTVESKDDTRLLPIASLTKLVTAVVARKLIPDDAHIAITEEVMRTYGNTADFRAGETFSAGDLLYPLLMVSSNDAAEAYAHYYGRRQFIQAMNDFAQSIGAYRTYFADPSGLDPRNESTAADLALILKWIRANDPTILSTTQLKTITVRDHTWVNPTHFLSWSYYLGGKNGYLPEANRTSASLFEWGDKDDVYAVVILGSEDRDADTIALLRKIGQE
jgi:serine-type D-Ala-D-Ala carboxypeptidase (penicillin-binding protein 5/6)